MWSNTSAAKRAHLQDEAPQGYHKTIGHRQELTVVKITAINA